MRVSDDNFSSQSFTIKCGFLQGDVVVMTQTPPDKNEWWNGTNTRSQQVGYFPGNYVREIHPVPGIWL